MTTAKATTSRQLSRSSLRSSHGGRLQPRRRPRRAQSRPQRRRKQQKRPCLRWSLRAVSRRLTRSGRSRCTSPSRRDPLRSLLPRRRRLPRRCGRRRRWMCLPRRSALASPPRGGARRRCRCRSRRARRCRLRPATAPSRRYRCRAGLPARHAARLIMLRERLRTSPLRWLLRWMPQPQLAATKARRPRLRMMTTRGVVTGRRWLQRTAGAQAGRAHSRASRPPR